jgi:hypothetical protein
MDVATDYEARPCLCYERGTGGVGKHVGHGGQNP